MGNLGYPPHHMAVQLGGLIHHVAQANLRRVNGSEQTLSRSNTRTKNYGRITELRRAVAGATRFLSPGRLGVLTPDHPCASGDA